MCARAFVGSSGLCDHQPIRLPGYYRESIHVDVSIYRVSSHMLACVRSVLHQLMKRRKVIPALHLHRLRHGIPVKLGCKRSWVQIPPARLRLTLLAERISVSPPVLAGAACETVKPVILPATEVAPDEPPDSQLTTTQALFPRRRHPERNRSLPWAVARRKKKPSTRSPCGL